MADMNITQNTLNMNGELAGLDFDDDEYQEEYVPTSTEDWEGEDEVPAQQTEEDDSWLSLVLRNKGIQDPSKIKFVDDEDNIQERSWESLSNEEKYNILMQQDDDSSNYEQEDQYDLSDEEINLLNTIRENNLTPSEYINQVVYDQLNQYAAASEPVYEIDSLSDDDLFMGDLKLRTPDITDEELLAALDQAKQNPELYSKQIAGIRQEYKALEDQNKEQEYAIQQQQSQEEYLQFQNQIFDGIDSLTGLGEIDIELDDNDKEELAQYILEPDSAGITQLQKDLANPEILTQVAWFLLRGADTIDGIVKYFTKEISNVRESSSKKAEPSKPTVVMKKPQRSTQVYNREITSIDQLD